MYTKINRNSLGQFLKKISRMFYYSDKGSKPYRKITVPQPK